MSPMRLLLGASRRAVILAVVAGTVAAFASAGLLALIHGALGEAPPSGATPARTFAALCAVVLASKIVSQAILIRLTQGAVRDLYLSLSRRILAAPLRRLEALGPARLLAVLTDDVTTIANALMGVPVVYINLAILLCCLGYIGWLSPGLLLAAVVALVVGIASYQVPVIWAMRRLEQAREQQDSLLRHVRGLIEGIKELKLNRARRDAFLSEALEPSAAALCGHNTAGLTLYTSAASWGQLLFLAFIGAVVFALPQLTDLPRDRLSGVTLAVLFMVAPLETIMGIVPMLGQARVALRKVEQLGLSLAVADAEGGAAPDGGAAAGRHLELRGVSHTYRREGEDEGFLLGPIDLEIRPGELTFLVGGNGSGKTTLAKLITGLYAPEAGEVCLDGVPVGAESREAYRQQFSAVFADSYLFDRLHGLGSAGLDARAREYLPLLHLDHKVTVRDGTFSTTELSQGQRKRLALLASYLEDRPVCVFDEWAADQDPAFKDVFYTRLLPELKRRGKTVLVITHDERYFGGADRLLRLVEGRLLTAGEEEAPGRPALATWLDTN